MSCVNCTMACLDNAPPQPRPHPLLPLIYMCGCGHLCPLGIKYNCSCTMTAHSRSVIILEHSPYSRLISK